MKTLNDIRSTFLGYFEKQGHSIQPSSPLVPQNDPTLGMTIFWSMYYGAVLSGWWWWYAPPIVVLVWIFVALYMTSSGLDAWANPKLRRT